MEAQRLRIHGDNILECESALRLLATALNPERPSFAIEGGSAYAPIYKLEANTGEGFLIQLFPGYGRWGFALTDYLASLGAPLREAPDAVITRVEEQGDELFETPILALEFSGALPAGNNAWQRTGRALALAYAGIPYLYFAELGGQELGADRVVKAARFPNPLVPFAYTVLGATATSFSLPIYLQSPSIESKVVEVFKDCFGEKESLEITRGIVLKEDTVLIRAKIEEKVLAILQVLTKQRKKLDVLGAEEWAELYSQKSGIEKARWLIKKAMPWNKKVGLKNLTSSFSSLIKVAIKSKAVAIGSKDMPICLLPGDSREFFATEVKTIYGNRINGNFEAWLSNTSRPLLCVWIAGFKPKGDDSRPDRGLVPLARMIFGLEDIDLLSIVYGPAKISTWDLLEKDMHKLASVNGLWESIIQLSDAVLIDSSTSLSMKTAGVLVQKNKRPMDKKMLPAASETPNFGEHDVDTVLHLIFSNFTEKGIYEGLCNPPGGDWSGINILDFDGQIEYRWTSLPRVSGKESKRPDHLIQFEGIHSLLSIESKDTDTSLEDGIGDRLKKYVQDLITIGPIAQRARRSTLWSALSSKFAHDFQVLSGVAFRFNNKEQLKKALLKGGADIAFGIQFETDGKTVVHVLSTNLTQGIEELLKIAAARFPDILRLEIHNSKN